MSALRDSMDRLLAFLRSEGWTPPTRDAWLIEVRPDAEFDERGRLCVQRAELRPLEAYEARFDELLGSGLPWINLNCCGLSLGRLVVLIETPRATGHRSSRVSVNLSGPTEAARKGGWDANEALAIR